VFADTHGNVVHLFERDCSVQRRHQKVLEEAPAPGMTQDLRFRMGQAATAAAKAVGYVGAGTVEFIVEQPGGYEAPEQMQFYFMEMNTRLQVEHPVTEAITGLDLVQWQLLVASGQPLPLRQEQLTIHGHAIEARICAENPDQNFLPATGKLAIYRKPTATNFTVSAVRIDDGVREGDAITPYYDSMIGKLIVHGATRQEALGLLDSALSQVRIAGVQTNTQFLRRVITTSSFIKECLDTALIERERDRLFDQDPLGVEMIVAAAVAHLVVTERRGETSDPFSRSDGFRSHGVASRRIDLEYQGQPVITKLRYLDDGLMLKVGDADPQALSLAAIDDGYIDVRYGSSRDVMQVFEVGEQLYVFGTLGAAQIAALDVLARASDNAVGTGRLTAPMPGKVISIAVKSGDLVKRDQPLAIIEAMKMEHTIMAPEDGVVDEVLYAPGDQVAEGAELLRLAS
jgi:3-methylcrotonyl-CoA carboxylase alpha subunit